MSQASQWALFKPSNREPSRTTLGPSFLLRVGKILINVNSDQHKLHISVMAFLVELVAVAVKAMIFTEGSSDLNL